LFRYVIRRIARGVITIWMVTLLVFVVLRLGGNPIQFITTPGMTAESRERLAKVYGFDKPIYVQYIDFQTSILTGDFGPSIYYSNVNAIDVVARRAPATIALVGSGLIVSMLLGTILGTIAATRARTRTDTVIRFLAVSGQSLPAFFLGLLLILIFSVWLKVLPSAGGIDRLGPIALVLPNFTVAWFLIAANTRLVRSAMLDALNGEYVQALRGRGIPERSIVWRHALRNASLPVVTLFAVNFSYLVGGVVVTEAIFSWPGIGRLLVESIFVHDYTVVQAVVFVSAALIVLVNLLVDLLYGWLDPRVRLA
jgi:peptide/nickel transport system permease protein